MERPSGHITCVAADVKTVVNVAVFPMNRHRGDGSAGSCRQPTGQARPAEMAAPVPAVPKNPNDRQRRSSAQVPASATPWKPEFSSSRCIVKKAPCKANKALPNDASALRKIPSAAERPTVLYTRFSICGAVRWPQLLHER